MSYAPHLVGWLLALSPSFNGPPLALRQSAFSTSAVQNSADETALRTLAEGFSKTWAAKDLDGFLRLWSATSPELEARRKATQELFAGSERIELRGQTIRAVKMMGDKARVRVEADAQVIETKTGKPRSGYGKMLRTLECVKEEGRWKVWRETSAFDDLATALAVAESDRERAALLAEEKDLVTAELVRSLSSQGSRFYVQGGYPQALASYRLAQSIGEQIGDQSGIARALGSIGNVHWSQGNYAEALDYYQKSLAMSEAVGDKGGIARSTNNLGNIHSRQGNYGLALEYYQKSLAMSEALGDKVWISSALNNIGTVHNQQGNYGHALGYYQKSLVMSEALGDKDGIAFALANMGSIRNRQGDYVQALEYFQKSLVMREALGDKAGIARSLRAIGDIHNQQGDYVQALGYYHKSLTQSEALGDKNEVARLLNNMGLVHRLQSDYIHALEYFQKSLAISESLGDKAGIALTLGNIGTVHDLQGNHAQGLEYFRKSLAMKEALGDKDEIAHTLNSIGIVYVHQGDFAQALDYYQKSLALKEAVGSQAGIAATLNNIGMIHNKQGNYARALEYFQKSLAMSEALGEKAGVASALKSIAAAHLSQGNSSQALEFAERAAAVARSIGASETLWESLTTAGRVYRQLNKPVEGRQALDEAMTVTEALRANVAGGEEEQQRFFESKVSPYHAMVDLLIAQSRPAEALAFAERAKARVLLDVLQTGRANVTKAMTSQQRELERKLRVELTSLNTQLTRAGQNNNPDQAKISELKSLREKVRLNYEAFQTSIYAAHPELRVQRGEAPVIKAEEIAALLPDAGSALLEYVVADDVTYLFAVTRAVGKPAADVQAYTLPIKRGELIRQTENLRRQLAGRDLGFRASARQLYQLLLKPARAQLRDTTNLVIAPDDKLWELPFQALLAEGDHYVIERSAVSYTPSLTVLREMKSQGAKRRAAAAGTALLAMGNPVIGQETIERATLALRDGKLDPLPEAEAEVKALGQLYGAARSKVYVGADAREDRAKAEAAQAGILHFATHGVLNDASPMYSHLVLAPGDKNEDGLLEAWELTQLDLKADLVVLSACETARGRYGAGEGMIGLTWALFVAGVPSTLVSQWKVESAGTSELMLDFHRQLRAPSAKATKAEALRHAALKLSKNPATSHPFYWAGFVLVGDGR